MLVEEYETFFIALQFGLVWRLHFQTNRGNLAGAIIKKQTQQRLTRISPVWRHWWCNTSVGPISLNYYDDKENQLGVMAHIGYLFVPKPQLSEMRSVHLIREFSIQFVNIFAIRQTLESWENYAFCSFAGWFVCRWIAKPSSIESRSKKTTGALRVIVAEKNIWERENLQCHGFLWTPPLLRWLGKTQVGSAPIFHLRGPALVFL